jgi:hypothetical protein
LQCNLKQCCRKAILRVLTPYWLAPNLTLDFNALAWEEDIVACK